MIEKKTSIFGSSLIWFGAAISIAEIMTGTLLAPLGMKKGIAAILLGHLIGCVLFYFAGLIGGETGRVLFCSRFLMSFSWPDGPQL